MRMPVASSKSVLGRLVLPVTNCQHGARYGVSRLFTDTHRVKRIYCRNNCRVWRQVGICAIFI